MGSSCLGRLQQVTKKPSPSSGHLNLLERGQKLLRKKRRDQHMWNITVQAPIIHTACNIDTSGSSKGKAVISTQAMLPWPSPRARRPFLTLQKTSVSFPTLLHAAVLPSSLPMLNKQGFTLQHQVSHVQRTQGWSSRQCCWGSFLALSFSIAW